MAKRKAKPVPLHLRRYSQFDDDGSQFHGSSIADMYPGHEPDEIDQEVRRLRKGASVVVGGGAAPAVLIKRTK